MYAFDYKRAATLEEARKALEGIAESKLLAGGMSIVPVLRYRLAQPSALIDLGKIEALKGVSEADNTIRIGAMTTHYAVSRSELVRNKGFGAIGGRYWRSLGAQPRHDRRLARA